MGLFRRGTKLLRIGSGLRDCCCRPERPEECFCPDWCRYYWGWSGNSYAGQVDLIRSVCDGPDASLSSPSFGYLEGRREDSLLPYGMVESASAEFLYGYSPGWVQIDGGYDLSPPAIKFSLFAVHNGVLSEAIASQVGQQSTIGGYYTRLEVRLSCESTDGNDFSIAPRQLVVSVSLDQQVSVFSGLSPVSPYQFFKYAEGVVDSTCIANDDFFCQGDLNADTRPRAHLLEQLDIVIGEAGVEVGGELLPWADKQPSVGVAQEAEIEGWEVANEYPLEATISIGTLGSCQPGDPCDCTASLTNRTVLFEGKEMTYGQLDNFFFPANPGDPYSGTWWAEDPVGTFTRRDVENCDGSLNQRVKVVEVDCINEGGVDKWVAYLDHTCNERDDLTCPGPADAQRVKQWTGFFLCDENGSPTGAPTDLEVDYDVTSGTPAAECVDALQPPSFEFL